MKRDGLLPIALVAALAVGWSLPAYAVYPGSCNNGKTVYNKTNAAVPTGCSNGNCHGANPANDKNNILNGQTPAGINNALDGTTQNAAMTALDLRNNLPLSDQDIDDIATWIFYAPTCPSSSPILQAAPAPVSFPSTTVGSTSAPIAVTVTNVGTADATSVSLTNNNAVEFLISGSTCTGTITASGGTCAFNLAFKPSASGARSANITVNRSGGAGVTIGASGTGSSGVTPGQLSMPAMMNFGSQTVGTTSGASSATITNIGGTSVTVSGVTSSNPAEFTIVSNSCSSVGAGGNCSVSVTFKPSVSGPRAANITVTSTGTGSPQTISASGTGGTGTGTGQLSIAGSVNAGTQTVGTTSAANTVTVTNIGAAAVSVSSVSSSNPSEFAITNSTCATVNAGASCSFSFTFKPSAAGARSATLTVVSNGTGSPQTVNASGTGTTGSGPQVVTVVEYYHAAFDHYFITSIADEITKLDNGIFVGWARTGYSFKAYAAAGTTTAPVCRFFSTAFAPKSSHFYTTYPGCTTLMSNPDWQFEAEVLIVALPAGDGTCAAGLVPVYRLYNNGQGGAPNHRYTTDASIKAQMLAKNYVIEGNGPGLAFMCTPP